MFKLDERFWWQIHAVHIINISSIFSSNSEAFASELLENIEEMFLQYYIHSNNFSIFTIKNINKSIQNLDTHITIIHFIITLKPELMTLCSWLLRHDSFVMTPSSRLFPWQFILYFQNSVVFNIVTTYLSIQW